MRKPLSSSEMEKGDDPNIPMPTFITFHAKTVFSLSDIIQ